MKFLLFSVVFIGFYFLIRGAPYMDFVFIKLGTYHLPDTFNVKKSYFIPRHFKAQWMYTRSICQAYGFELVSLDTLEEYEAVAAMCQMDRDLLGSFVHVGGMARTAKSKTDWCWVNSKNFVSYNMTWQDGQPDGDNEYCLSLQKDGGFKFNDISCYGGWEEKFICQSVEKIYQEVD